MEIKTTRKDKDEVRKKAQRGENEGIKIDRTKQVKRIMK